MKTIIYIDMDGVVADFDSAIKAFLPDLETGCGGNDYEERAKLVDAICADNPNIFHTLKPINGAIEAVTALLSEPWLEVYFLSTPMWHVPDSFTGKRIWIEHHFGELAKKRLILTHRKDLQIGDILIDDRLKNGASEFRGKHIHFGTADFPDWPRVMSYLALVMLESYSKNP